MSKHKRMVGYLEARRLRREREAKLRKDKKLAQEHLLQIQQHPETKVITKKDFPEVWAFVEDLFPSIANRIATTTVYKNTNTAFAKKLGIPPFAGGIFFQLSSSIMICWSKNHPDDVVLVHELLHFSSQLLGGFMRNSIQEEFFAYSKSLPYLVKRGFSREWIAEEYLYYWYYDRFLSEAVKRFKVDSDKLTLGQIAEVENKTLEKTRAVVAEVLDGVSTRVEEEVDRFDLI